MKQLHIGAVNTKPFEIGIFKFQMNGFKSAPHGFMVGPHQKRFPVYADPQKNIFHIDCGYVKIAIDHH